MNPKESARFVTCPCQHCKNPIQFGAADISPGESKIVSCPHCGDATALFEPEPKQEKSRLVTCHCQHCNGAIEFDPNDLNGRESAAADCPYCKMETIIFIPHPSSGGEAEPSVAAQPPILAPVEVVSRPGKYSVGLQPAQRTVAVKVKLGLNPLGIASLLVGTIACLFCWIPFLGVLVIPLAAIGCVLAVIGLILAAIHKGTGFASPITGGVISLLSIFMALAMTGVVTGQVGKIISNIGNADTQWSTTGDVRQGDVQVTLEKVVNGAGLRIELRISNLSSTKKLDFTTWEAPKVLGENVTLTDNNQNSYKRYVTWMEDMNTQSSIYPGQSADIRLSFESPVDNLEWLHLELPAENFGGAGVIRFEIPKSSFIQSQNTP